MYAHAHVLVQYIILFVALFMFKLQIYLCRVHMFFDTYFAINAGAKIVSKNIWIHACETLVRILRKRTCAH